MLTAIAAAVLATVYPFSPAGRTPPLMTSNSRGPCLTRWARR